MAVGHDLLVHATLDTADTRFMLGDEALLYPRDLVDSEGVRFVEVLSLIHI